MQKNNFMPGEQTVNFEDIDELLGVSTKPFEFTDTATFSDKDQQALGNIIASGTQTGIDTSRPPVAPTETPEYLSEFKDVLSKPFEVQPDTTDYAAKSLVDFGQGYAHITTKDTYEEELFTRAEEQEYLQEQPAYKALLDISEGRIEKGILLNNEIKNAMQREAQANFRKFDDSAYDERVAQYYNEDGTLNQEGTQTAERIVNHYKTSLQGLQSSAKQYAVTELEKYRKNRSALDTVSKEFKIAGEPVQEDYADYLKSLVTSGKAREWLEKELTPEENANREMWLAIISDKHALAKMAELLDIRGQNQGINVVAKRKFNS